MFIHVNELYMYNVVVIFFWKFQTSNASEIQCTCSPSLEDDHLYSATTCTWIELTSASVQPLW